MAPVAHRSVLSWSGSTGTGWAGYERSHSAAAPSAADSIGLTTGEPHGDPSLHNPEQLVVMAASSCQMLVFLHLAAKARIDVVDYRDEAVGEMSGDGDGPPRIERITLRPRITLAGGTGPAAHGRVRRLVELAHEHCYVANSLRSEIRIEPEALTGD